MRYKYSGNLNKDIFDDFAWMRADQMVIDLQYLLPENRKLTKELIEKITLELEKKIYKEYAKSEIFESMSTTELVRDYFILHGQQLLEAVCKSKFPAIFNLMPRKNRRGV